MQENISISDELNLNNFDIWLNARPNWEKYLWHLHNSKRILEVKEIENCYNLLLGNNLESNTLKYELRGQSIFNSGESEEVKSNISISRISCFKNVNAIDGDSVLEFSPHLTIIYGDNGSGKSGIGRLLSNACSSRKTRKLLHNVKADSQENVAISASFVMLVDDVEVKVKYNIGDFENRLKCFAVFDSESALFHIDKENKIEFTPSKFKIFEDLFGSIVEVENKLNAENERRKMDKAVVEFLSDESDISKMIKNLSFNTKINDLKKSLEFSDLENTDLEAKKNELSSIMKLDVAAKKKQLEIEYKELMSFVDCLKISNFVLNEKKALEINNLIKLIIEKNNILKGLSVDKFEHSNFKHIGSVEWKVFIEAAEKLYMKEKESNLCEDLSNCPLCRQKLTHKEYSLFNEYWSFLNSTAEEELKTLNKQLEVIKQELVESIQNWPKLLESETAVKILTNEKPAELGVVKNQFIALKNELNDWITNIDTMKYISFKEVDTHFSSFLSLALTKKESAETLIDPISKISDLNIKILNLEHKKIASGKINIIINYVKWLQWEANLKRAKSEITISRTSITKKKVSLINDAVMRRYIKNFSIETKKLHCNFDLKTASRGLDGETLKAVKLNIEGNHNPSEILSEGEQRVVALADFLAEVNTDNLNCGVIFDDPASSLDHLRKNDIAKRLVEESTKRQVIILTHDISFLFDLDSVAESLSVKKKIISIRRRGDSVGVINGQPPWFTLKTKERVNHLRLELSKLKKNEFEELYYKNTKSWIEDLRETWERAVEEILLNGLVVRYRPSIETKRLEEVVITDELKKYVNEGMTKTSEWIHDKASALNPRIPTTHDLEEMLTQIDDFVKRCGKK